MQKSKLQQVYKEQLHNSSTTDLYQTFILLTKLYNKACHRALLQNFARECISDRGWLCCCHLELAELCLGQLSSANECQIPQHSVSLFAPPCPHFAISEQALSLQCRIYAHTVPCLSQSCMLYASIFA